MRVRIYVVEVGQRFGHRGLVSVSGRVAHSTRAFPFGFFDEARRYAVRWARDHGYALDPLPPQIDLSRSPVAMPGKVSIPGRIAMPGKIDLPWGRR